MQYLNGLIEMYMCVCLLSHSVVSDSETLWIVASRLLCPWDPLGKDTGVGCHAILQEIFLTQRSNLSLYMSLALACRFFTTQLPRKQTVHAGNHCFLAFQNIVCTFTDFGYKRPPIYIAK